MEKYPAHLSNMCAWSFNLILIMHTNKSFLATHRKFISLISLQFRGWFKWRLQEYRSFWGFGLIIYGLSPKAKSCIFISRNLKRFSLFELKKSGIGCLEPFSGPNWSLGTYIVSDLEQGWGWLGWGGSCTLPAGLRPCSGRNRRWSRRNLKPFGNGSRGYGGPN